MPRYPQAILTPIRHFIRQDDGVATVDWVVICAGATGMAIMALNMSEDSVGTYTTGVRDEVQNPYFETSWTSAVVVPPREEWDEREPITPVYEDSSSSDPVVDPDQGGDPDPSSDPDPDDSDSDGGSTGGGGSNDDDDADDDAGDVGGVTNPPPLVGPQVVSGVISGCPSPDYIAEPIRFTADNLDRSALDIMVRGAGSTPIGNCGGLPGNGYFNANPSITLDLSGFSSSWDEFRVRTQKHCDVSILVLDAQGNWYAGENRNNNLLEVEDNLTNFNGLVSIWVGLDRFSTCDRDNRIRIDADD